MKQATLLGLIFPVALVLALFLTRCAPQSAPLGASPDSSNSANYIQVESAS